ncbi:hypothetical protein ACFQNE_11055 [Gordonia phosphorivorans]|uniref:Uracil-DNA glycosylase-like domain-containing protein n=1 Tax=Gordonia phosphorivorans TaxID=1056982 RepID=A0ABV6H9N9_9ACTN
MGSDDFDRELDQYRLVAEQLTARLQELDGKMDECRDGGDLLVDYQRYANEHDQVRKKLVALAAARRKYIEDRDRLIAWGPTGDRVVAGSIVTVKYLSGELATFVLTQRPFDSEYEVVPYGSPIDIAIRRRRKGDRVSLPAGALLVIEDVRPGFRGARSGGEVRAETPDPALTARAAMRPSTGAEPAGWLTQQKCGDKTYREDLYRRRFEPNVRQINDYVERLRAQRSGAFIPYLSAEYGGVNARLLTLYQDPGPQTDPSNPLGSGMLSLENADLSAARAKYFLDRAGIDVSEIVSWNAYPWTKPHPQTPDTDREAALALVGFLGLVPDLAVVVLNGKVAQRIWKVAKQIDPGVGNRVTAYSTFHPSPRVIDPAEKSPEYIEMVNQDIEKKYIAARRRLRAKWLGGH